MPQSPQRAPYAASDLLNQRRHDEPHLGSAFQVDRNRVLRCSAFRRLDFKTQVFVPHEHDHYRTRLTHSLEVAQVGRDLARSLALNEDLVEAVALAHDLGHPPFGHAGEAVLDRLMSDHGHFEHNRQSLRIVDYLEHPFPAFRGLNLTQVARECMARHETKYDTPTCPEFPRTGQAPLEGQLVDLADEIAYSVADLEDALGVNWLSEADLADQPLWQRAYQRAQQACSPDARPIHVRIEAVRQVLAVLHEATLAETTRRLEQQNIATLEDVRSAPQRCVALPTDIRAELDALQLFLLQKVYRHPTNCQLDQQAEQILRDLFGTYVSDPQKLPDRYRRRIDQVGANDEIDNLQRVVCDYIAGMTDRFCRAEHARQCSS